METNRYQNRWKRILQTSRTFLNQNVRYQTAGKPKITDQNFEKIERILTTITGYWKATGQNFGNPFNANQMTSKLVNMEILACWSRIWGLKPWNPSPGGQKLEIKILKSIRPVTFQWPAWGLYAPQSFSRCWDLSRAYTFSRMSWGRPINCWFKMVKKRRETRRREK